MRTTLIAAIAITFAMSGLARAATDPRYDVWVKAYWEDHMKDPASVIYKEDRGVRRGTITPPYGESITGNLVCYKVNGKNSYAAYVGNEYYLFAFGEMGIIRAFTMGSDLVDEIRLVGAECGHRSDEDEAAFNLAHPATSQNGAAAQVATPH